MSDLRALYRSSLGARGKAPRYRGLSGDAGARLVEAENPVCGDRLTLEVGETIAGLTLRFDGHACLLCVASVDHLAEAVEGASRAVARERVRRFLDALDTGDREKLASLNVDALLEARAWPIRVACVRLPWRALEAHLASPDEKHEDLRRL